VWFVVTLQHMSGLSAPEPVEFRLETLMQSWRYADSLSDEDRSRVMHSLEASGTKFWNVLALQVRVTVVSLCVGLPAPRRRRCVSSCSQRRCTAGHASASSRQDATVNVQVTLTVAITVAITISGHEWRCNQVRLGCSFACICPCVA
jgi:hypothetical protein